MSKQGLQARAFGLAILAGLASNASASDSDQPTVTRVGGQFTITLAEGWSVYDQSAAVLGTASDTGLVIFSAEPLVVPGQARAEVDQLAKVDRGELPSFFVDRQRAERGMNCEKLSRSAIYNIGMKVIQDPAVGAARRHFGALAPAHTPIEIGGCQGVRFHLESGKGDEARHWMIDVRAASDGKTLYLFALRNPIHNYARNLEAFDAAMASVRFTGGR